MAAARPWGRALGWLAFLAPFFFASYGLANWSASLRESVPAIVFDWERAIPFWPWTIVPYWIIDALYGVSLFLCATRRELDAHGRRLLTAQFVAVGCFVLFPHRFTFDRPDTDGAFGALFGVLMGFDKPFNQIPSLHIALAVILWNVYASKVEGIARGIAGLTFVLIGASVLTTYQHHFIDIPTGFALGWLCVWLWPDGTLIAPWKSWTWTRDGRRRRIAAMYGVGGLGSATAAIAMGGLALWLWWPALSLWLVANFYAAIGASGFQKRRDGRQSLAARWLLAPYVAGAWINSRAWTWAKPRATLVADGVWIGRTPTRTDLQHSSFASVVDMSPELSLDPGTRAIAVFASLDLITPSMELLMEAVAAIERLRGRGPVLVCCALGYSRSACAVAAWLLATRRVESVEAALARLQSARSHVVLGPAHTAALRSVVAYVGS
jgi:protein-tyrosine phosphatase/membrane-associated phospholipid phosphatase